MPIGPTSGFLDFTNATPRANVIIALSNVGVGTDVPLHALDIRGTANVADIIINNDLTLIGGLTTNTLTINSVSMSTTSNFQQVTNVGDAATTNTVQFTNPTTGFTVSSNAEVGGELSVSGNTVVSSNLTVSGNVGIGTTEPTESLDIVGNLNLQKVSNTASIKLNSNVVTEYVRSKKSLIKYPRVALTGSNDGSGYVVTQASGTAWGSPDNRNAWALFDGVNQEKSGHAGPHFTSGGADRYAASGEYTGTNTLGGVDGDWVYIRFPENVKVQFIDLWVRNVGRTPTDATVLGSLDGQNWNIIGSWKDYSSFVAGQSTRFTINANDYYDYIGLVFEKIGANASGKYVNFFELDIYGVPEYDPDAHGTDVIARSVPNVPNTDWLEVYYDGQDYTSMPSTVTDKSGNGVTGTPTNVTFDSEYKAFTFDGSGDYITGTLSNPSGDWMHSVSCWVYATELSSSKSRFVSHYGVEASRQQVILAIKHGRVVVDFNSDNIGKDVSLVANTWYHIAFTYPGGGTSRVKIYINGIDIGASGGGTTALNIASNRTLYIGKELNINYNDPWKGSIANFRLFNRALTGDEIWQLYAYQKEYFDVSPDVVTFKGGRLGIGTSEPRAPLDVMGIPYGPGARPIFSAYESDDYSVTATGYIVLGNTFVNGLNCYNTSTGIFVAPLDGIYCFIGNCVMRSSSGGSGNSTWTFHINGTNWNPTSTGRPIAYQAIDSGTNHQQTSGSLIFYLNKGDSVRIYAGAVPSNTNQNWGQGYGRFLGFLLS